jgi:hypothetical protein
VYISTSIFILIIALKVFNKVNINIMIFSIITLILNIILIVTPLLIYNYILFSFMGLILSLTPFITLLLFSIIYLKYEKENVSKHTDYVLQ